MVNFFDYSQVNIAKSNIKNSLILFLPKKNEYNINSYLKCNSSFRGLYFDSILKDYIYVSSAGFKKDLFFRKKTLSANIFNLWNLKFVSFFSKYEPKILNFYFYLRKYNKHLVFNSIIKSNKCLDLVSQEFILKTNKNRLRRHNFFLKSFSNFIKWKYNKVKKTANYPNLRFYLKRNYYFITIVKRSGLIIEESKFIVALRSFTGLMFIMPNNVQRLFVLIIKLFNLLINFYIDVYPNRVKHNKNMLYKIVLYNMFYNNLLNNLFEYLTTSLLSFRKSNKSLLKYKLQFHLKFSYFISKLFNLAYNKIFSNKSENIWLNWFFFNKNLHNIYINKNEDDITLFYGEINKYSFLEKVEIFKHLFYLSKIRSLNKFLFSETSLKEIYTNLKLYLFFDNLKIVCPLNFKMPSNLFITFWVYNVLVFTVSNNSWRYGRLPKKDEYVESIKAEFKDLIKNQSKKYIKKLIFKKDIKMKLNVIFKKIKNRK